MAVLLNQVAEARIRYHLGFHELQHLQQFEWGFYNNRSTHDVLQIVSSPEGILPIFTDDFFICSWDVFDWTKTKSG